MEVENIDNGNKDEKKEIKHQENGDPRIKGEERKKERSRSKSSKSKSYSNSKYDDRKSVSDGSDKERYKSGLRREDWSPISVLVFIPRGLYQDFKDDAAFERLRKDIGVDKLKYASYNLGEDYDGKVLSLYDEDNEKKLRGAERLVDEIVKFEEKKFDKKFKDDRDVMPLPQVSILIPDGKLTKANPSAMVSLLIGKKGRQIHKIMSDSGTKIVVSKSIRNSRKRPVRINGKGKYIKRAVKIIVEIVQKMLSKVQYPERKQRYSPDRSAHVQAKLVVKVSQANYIIGDDGYFAKGLRREFNTSIKLFEDSHVRCLERDDYILLVSGKLRDVQDSLVFLIRRAHSYYESRSPGREELIRMLIPNIYVTKLIGTKGSMIREIAARSCGAQIKILSSREAEKERQDCIVTIAGTLANKQDAVCIILEKLEDFKNSDYERRNFRRGSSYFDSTSMSPRRRSYRESRQRASREYKKRYYKQGRSRSRSRSRDKSNRSSRRAHRKTSKGNSKSRSKHASKSPKKEVIPVEPDTIEEEEIPKEEDHSHKNMSFMDTDSIIKMTNLLVIPEYLIPHLTDNDNQMITEIAEKSKSRLEICNKDEKILTVQKQEGRFLNLTGTPKANSDAFQLLQEKIIDLETSLNGRRKIDDSSTNN